MQSRIGSLKESLADVAIGNLISAIIVLEASFFYGMEFQSSLILWIHSNLLSIPLSYARRRYFNAKIRSRKSDKKKL